MAKLSNPRYAAAQVITHVFKEQGSLTGLISRFSAHLAPADISFFKELCFGTLRHGYALEHHLNSRLTKSLRNKDSDVKALLMIGLYQMLYMKVSDHAAIGETAGVAKDLKKPWATSLINATLRGVQREPLADITTKQPVAYFNHPQWMLDAFKNDWPKYFRAILDANNSRAPMTLRVNAQKCTRDSYLELLNSENIDGHACQFAEHGITLTSPVNVTALPHFEDGWVSVQDEAAQLSAQLLSAKAGERILDACAAPGGKLCHILESAPDLDCTAIEIEEKRLDRIYQNLERLQLKANVIHADAADTQAWWDGQFFDRILLDAPCSAMGVLRRHPDIRFVRHQEKIQELSGLQLSLLEKLWPTLKSGGVLLYATCSSLKQENEQIIAQFLSRQPDCEEVPLESTFGINALHGRQLLPIEGGHDGFYYCLLGKK